MDFTNEINALEEQAFDTDYIVKKGKVPILFTVPHTMKQIRTDGTVKLREPYTKAIALYLNKFCDVNAMVKIKDIGLDANRDNHDQSKTELLRFIKDNHIKLVIDLYGAAQSRDFDFEFGTLNNLSIDFPLLGNWKKPLQKMALIMLNIMSHSKVVRLPNMFMA